MASLRVPGGEVCLPGDVSREVSSRVQPRHHLHTSSIFFSKHPYWIIFGFALKKWTVLTTNNIKLSRQDKVTRQVTNIST